MAEEEKDQAAPQGQEQTQEQGSMLDEIVQATKLQPADDAYGMAKRGVEALMAQLLDPEKKGVKVSKKVVDDMITEIDKKLSLQVDAILHAKEFQKIESSWRSLKYLVDHTDFRENIKLEFVNINKDDLLMDFEDAPEVPKSGLYKTVYTAEYGQFGGQPYGAMIGNYEFGAGPQDIKLLQYVASVAAMAHAPFVAAAGPQMFGKFKDFTDLPNLKDLKAVFEGAEYTKWRSFRESEDARYVGLTCPRFLLRLPYAEGDPQVKAFTYIEDVTAGHDSYLWGNTAFAFASRLTDSFAKYRWCANIIGPKGGGAVEDLNLHQFESKGAVKTKIPTEALFSDRREYELAEEGFIGLTMRKGSDNAAFFSANSVQKAKIFANTKEGKAAETNYKLGLQLPYMMIINRLAHYLKVIQRENIGTWKEKNDLQDELNTWIRQYVADQESPQAGVRSRRPLRQAEVTVDDVAGEPGWYRVGLKVRPHFKYMGSFFTLSLVGKLDKE